MFEPLPWGDNFFLGKTQVFEFSIFRNQEIVRTQK